MTCVSTSRGVGRLLLCALTVVAALAAPLAPRPASAQTDDVTPGDGTRPTPPGEADAAELARQAEWRRAMERIAKPQEGCYRADYPELVWKVVPCGEAPKRPYPPHRGRRPLTVGDGTDYSADPAGLISGAEGSFDSVVGVTSMTGTTYSGGVCMNPVTGVANVFSLQMNSAPFTTTLCNPSPNPGCLGWQQFVYSNDTTTAFMQYWLLEYNTACPASWNTFTFPGSTDIYCYRNGTGVTTALGTQTVANLPNLRMEATATAGGNDTVEITNGTTTLGANNPDNTLNLAGGWGAVEYNIFGDACGSEVVFNAGSTITVRTTTHSGTTSAPSCVMDGYTGETNNLTLVGTAAVGTGPSPAIVFTQSNVPGTPASCSTANGTGDTHLRTFGQLMYDFQATGDFLLVESDNRFVVQARQISGAPRWPSASVNEAVATRIGKTEVAVCLPERVVVDGRPVEIENGGILSLPDLDIVRHGNTYDIIGQTGDSLRVVVNDGWINGIVGLGHWPARAHGLLMNARRGQDGAGVDLLAARDGKILQAPFPFGELYGHYADSWRVPKKDSILNACGPVTEVGRPKEIFYARDLEPKVFEEALAICREFDVREGPLLEACILDVAFTGNKTAAEAFVRMTKPVLTGQIVP